MKTKPIESAKPLIPTAGSLAGTTSGSPRPNTKACARWRWHHRILLALRERLVRAHADHAQQAIAPVDNTSNDPADSSQEQTDRDILWAELTAEDNQLFEIDAALDRIRTGSYGRCEVTGAPIPAARLHALPWTRFCRTAARRLETERPRPLRS